MSESENQTLAPDPASIETGVAPDSLERELRELARAPSVFPAATLRTGDLVSGRFELMDKLGAGGMGVVYLAHDRRLDRSVAIKFHTADASDEARARLLREAQAMAKITHQNVITVHEVGEYKSQVYIAMEYLDGGTVRDLEKSGGASEERILGLFLAAGRGLAAAHAAGLVHRDFKPDNILLGTDGRIRVADFGLARGAGVPVPSSAFENTAEGSVISGSGSLPSITRTGKLLGTPAYMAPEQFFHGDVDGRADQYAFCVALHEALTGKRPFDGMPSYQRRHGDEVTTHTKLPRRVRRVLARGLARQPADRYPSMDQLLAALDPADRRRRRRLLGAGVAGMAVAALGLTVAQGRQDDAVAQADLCPAMEPTFDEKVPPELVEAFLSKVQAFDPEAHAMIESRLADQRTTWAEVARDACRQARVTGTATEILLDRKMECLDREATAVALRLERGSRGELASLDTYMFDDSAQISDCGRTDIANSPRFSRDYPGDDPEVTADLWRRYQDLQLGVEDPHRGVLELQTFQSLHRDAQNLENPQLRGTVSMGLASALVINAKFDEALPHLTTAYRLARESEDIDLALNVARNIAVVEGYYRDDLDLGRAWSTVASAEVDKPGVSTTVAINVLLSAGLLDEIAGNFEGSLEKRLRAEELLKTRGLDPADRLYLKVRADLAVSYELAGKLDEADATYKDVIALRREHYPPSSAQTQVVRNNYALFLYQSGRPDEATPILEDILSQYDCEVRTLDCASTRLNLALALMSAAEYERAGKELDKAQVVIIEESGPNHRDASLVWEAQAELATHEGRLDDALDYLQKSIDVNLTLDGRDDPDLGRRYQQMGYILGKQGKSDEGLEMIERAREQLGKGYRPDHNIFVSLEITKATILHRGGDTKAALEILRTIEADAPTPRDVTEARDLIAEYSELAPDE